MWCAAVIGLTRCDVTTMSLWRATVTLMTRLRHVSVRLSVCLSVCVAVSVYVWSRHPTDRQLWLYRTQSLATLRLNSPQTPLVAPDEASIAFQLDYCNAVVPSPALWHAYSIVAAVCSVSYTLTSLIVRQNDTQLSSRVYVSSKGNFYSLFL